jgi:hypothetical protein
MASSLASLRSSPFFWAAVTGRWTRQRGCDGALPISWTFRYQTIDVPLAVLMFAAACVGPSLITGWLGGELVVRTGIGVDQVNDLDAPGSLSQEHPRERSHHYGTASDARDRSLQDTQRRRASEQTVRTCTPERPVASGPTVRRQARCAALAGKNSCRSVPSGGQMNRANQSYGAFAVNNIAAGYTVLSLGGDRHYRPSPCGAAMPIA